MVLNEMGPADASTFSVECSRYDLFALNPERALDNMRKKCTSSLSNAYLIEPDSVNPEEVNRG
jgi:hypothetical protein